MELLAGALLLLALVTGWILVFESFTAAAGLAVIGLLVAPFAILGTCLVRGGARTLRGWDRPQPPGDSIRPADDEGDPVG